jgi:hypothetical protein
MNASKENQGLRSWWASPPRTGIRRTIAPWEYRHLRFSGVTRMVAGALLVIGGVMFLSYGAYGWAALFLVIGGLNIGGGYWYLTMAPSAAAGS